MTESGRGGEGRPASLSEAVLAGDAEAVVCLLDEGADVDVRDARGRTPLMHAVREGHAGIAAMLPDRGADPGSA